MKNSNIMEKIYLFISTKIIKDRFIPGFDTYYYLRNNPDVAKSKTNPLRHYMNYGWKEGRRPSLGFDGNVYLSLNPDVAAAGVNPLKHFIEYGICEGRPWQINTHEPVVKLHSLPEHVSHASEKITNYSASLTKLL